MKKALRIESNAKVQSLNFWKRLLVPNLADFLLEKAKKDGIERVSYQTAYSGYTKGHPISYPNSTDFIPSDLPVVLEFIDDESRLNSFYESIRSNLLNEKAYFLNLEMPKLIQLN